MPWEHPPDDYEVQPGDIVRLRLELGFLSPPAWLVQDALAWSSWSPRRVEYEGDDLILELQKQPTIGPEIIKAGTLPYIVTGIVAAAVGTVAAALIVKDYSIWRDQSGDWHFESRSSWAGLLLAGVVVAGLVAWQQK